MTTRKREDYLELAQGSDSEAGSAGSGYDSEEHESKAARHTKRRKVSREVDRDSDDESFDTEVESSSGKIINRDVHKNGTDGGRSGALEEDALEEDVASDEEHDDETEDDADIKHSLKPSSKLLPASKRLKTTKPKKGLKTGIIYLPRLPPFLKPSALRTLLTPYTKHGISRLFLTPESPTARIQRLRGGGNKKHLYTDGWVEFHSKTDAKVVVDACNGTIIGGKKGSYYRDDVWSMRYLRGFKWGDLVGERRDEEAERTGRLDAERRKGKREVALFLGNVERAKVEETRRKKAETKAASGGGERAEKEERKFTFRQNEVLKKTGSGREKTRPGEEVQRVLSKIF